MNNDILIVNTATEVVFSEENSCVSKIIKYTNTVYNTSKNIIKYIDNV